MKRNRYTNSDLQNITPKLKSKVTRIPLKTVGLVYSGKVKRFDRGMIRVVVCGISSRFFGGFFLERGYFLPDDYAMIMQCCYC
jgi:hypothetical protein